MCVCVCVLMLIQSFCVSLLCTAYYVGEGSFGRVLQAKADGIVLDMPKRNLVAIKTTKGVYLFLCCV